MRDDTLIVSATYDDSYREWYDMLPEPKIRVSTADGGHPSGAFVNAFRFDRQKHHSYLFLQDSLEPTYPAPASLFRMEADAAAMQGKHYPVVGWARFPMFFDTPEQQAKVVNQYPYVPKPEYGIFGPILWVERKVMERLDKFGRFPATPENKMDAQGTERAWAYAFAAVGAPITFLHDWDNDFLASGQAAPFRKVFAGRQ